MSKKMLYIAIYIAFLPFWFVGQILYYLGKILKACGYFFSGYVGSAKREFKDFRSFTYDVSDI